MKWKKLNKRTDTSKLDPVVGGVPFNNDMGEVCGWAGV